MRDFQITRILGVARLLTLATTLLGAAAFASTSAAFAQSLSTPANLTTPPVPTAGALVDPGPDVRRIGCHGKASDQKSLEPDCRAAGIPRVGAASSGARRKPNGIALNPVLPSWVRVGTTVKYLGYSAFVQNGQYIDPVEIAVTSRITGIGSAGVAGTTAVQNVGEPGGHNYSWLCNLAGICRGADFQFWVDPQDPTGSVRGPDGEVFAIAGSGRYTDPWGRTWNATLLNYENNQNGVRFTIAYDDASGVILYNVESYPTEYIIQYYYS